MNKKSLFVFPVIALVVLAIYAAGKILLRNVFTPAFLPSTENIREDFATPLKFPLTVPSGYQLKIYADLNEDMPRALTFDPNGVLIASITNKGKVVALPDGKEKIILSDLRQPHGITFLGNKLYVAETDRVSRYDYDPLNLTANNRVELFTLPSGGGHFTRTIKILGDKLYTTIGSSCNVCVENEPMQASMWIADLDGKNLRLFAKGLRNTVFFTFDKNGQIWGNDMGRDLLGDNLPPDELNVIRDGGDYGWPYCYGDRVRDQKFLTERNISCDRTVAPAFKYPAHVAPLGITFDAEENILAAWHGSWNSSVPVGYKVVKLTVKDGQVTGVSDFISGWLSDGKVLGRPVDLIYDRSGNLFISDDKAGLIYLLAHE